LVKLSRIRVGVGLVSTLVALLLSTLFCLALASPGNAQSNREADLAAIRSQIGQLEQRLGKVEASAEDLAGQLERTELELELQEQKVLEARTARDLASEQVVESTRRAGELEGELKKSRQALRSRLRGLYRIGGLGYLRLLLSVDPEADSLGAVRLLRYLAQRDAAAIDRFTSLQKNLEEERGRLLEHEAQVEAWTLQAEERQQQLAGIRRRQARVLARLEKQREVLEVEAEALREKERKLAELLDRLASTSEEGLDGTSIHGFKGVLDWPVTGEVKQGFGTVRDPRYGTKLRHNGLGLSLAGTEPVKAIYPGNVLFAGPFEGYGSMVVLLHPGRVFSIYTGLRDLQVAQGNVLSLNDEVGSAEDQLYFEIRVEKRPEDPLEWLR